MCLRGYWLWAVSEPFFAEKYCNYTINTAISTLSIDVNKNHFAILFFFFFFFHALRNLVPFAQFKNCVNSSGGVILFVKLQAKASIHGCFSCFLNYTNCTFSRKASHLISVLEIWEVVARRCSVRKVFLKIFPLIFVKFLRTPFFAFLELFQTLLPNLLDLSQ